MAFEVQLDGYDALLKALDAYPDIARPIVARAAEAALLSLIPSLADYPSPPAASTYRRTGTLGRLWTAARPEFEPMQSGFEASIGNTTPYGPFVQSAERQAHWMRHWTNTDQRVVEDHQAEIQQFFDQALQEVADAIDAQAGGT